jgi:hypothetical protein
MIRAKCRVLPEIEAICSSTRGSVDQRAIEDAFDRRIDPKAARKLALGSAGKITPCFRVDPSRMVHRVSFWGLAPQHCQ